MEKTWFTKKYWRVLQTIQLFLSLPLYVFQLYNYYRQTLRRLISYTWFIWPLKNTIRIIWVIKRKKEKNSFVCRLVHTHVHTLKRPIGIHSDSPFQSEKSQLNICHTDANHTDRATFPKKHIYTYIKKRLILSKKPIAKVRPHHMTGVSQHACPRERAREFK